MDHAWGSLRISTDYKQLQWFDISDRPTNNWWWRQYFSKSNYNLSTWGPLISLVLLVQMFWSPDKYNVPFILCSTTSLYVSLINKILKTETETELDDHCDDNKFLPCRYKAQRPLCPPGRLFISDYNQIVIIKTTVPNHHYNQFSFVVIVVG